MRDGHECDENDEEPPGRPAPGGSPADQIPGVLRAFGRQLKWFRLRAGLDRPAFGALVGYAPKTIAAYEQGRRVPPPAFIDLADGVLDAGGVLGELKAEVAQAQYPAFFRDAARLESEAVELHVYANQVVPGLLQTNSYATAVFRMMRPPLDDATLEQRVAGRLARQTFFSRRPAPLATFVIDESVLRRPIGGRTVLREQLEHLLAAALRRTVDIQVMPLGREENAGLAGPFTLMETGDGRRIAYVEVQNVSRVHTERPAVRGLETKYSSLRAQALTPQESMTFIECLLGES
ncbi:putative DNA-binding protein [Streptomyces griseoaurantiacus M045]|uniref:Putative DNA-binding protein n=1 Tax=Streptomyces griseoaurantiacus M045 TaxID=996637 RepID=F3NN50_9ACTN|nr:helix-turn-helix transcriptional regulator [Streptomyces griseoaurantiacus]EGG45236.1 putative DNA-binding protein [Streptomyces griseoaurantiacus M045]